MLLDFIIIGAQKSGTTALLHTLKHHPDIDVSLEELNFLIEKKSIQSAQKYIGEIFSDSLNGEKTIGIKGAEYLGNPQCAQFIHKLFPEVKLIAILRNPVDRAISAYHHLIRYGQMPTLEAEEGIRMVFDEELDNDYPEAKTIREYGLYYRHLSVWEQVYGKDALLILKQENLDRDIVKESMRVVKFLGLKDSNLPQPTRRRQAVTYQSERLKFLAMAGKIRVKLLKWDKAPKKLREILAKFVWYLARAVDLMVLKYIFGDNQPEISEGLRKRVARYYKDDQDKMLTLKCIQ